MVDFLWESVADALERSIANATHLRDVDAAAVAAARALARKIDAWDVIVDWALDDASETRGARPTVPANDNVSISSFLKYLDQLRLVPDDAPAAAGAPPAENQIEAMRKKLARG